MGRYRVLPVVLALCQPQLTVHDELGGSFQIGAAVGHGLGVLGRKFAQHPIRQVVVRAGLGSHTDADAGKAIAAQPGDGRFGIPFLRMKNCQVFI